MTLRNVSIKTFILSWNSNKNMIKCIMQRIICNGFILYWIKLNCMQVEEAHTAHNKNINPFLPIKSCMLYKHLIQIFPTSKTIKQPNEICHQTILNYLISWIISYLVCLRFLSGIVLYTIKRKYFTLDK